MATCKKCGRNYSVLFAELGSGICNKCNVSYQEKSRLRLDEQRHANAEFLAGLAQMREPIRAIGRSRAMLLALGISAIQIILLIVLGFINPQDQELSHRFRRNVVPPAPPARTSERGPNEEDVDRPTPPQKRTANTSSSPNAISCLRWALIGGALAFAFPLVWLIEKWYDMSKRGEREDAAKGKSVLINDVGGCFFVFWFLGVVVVVIYAIVQSAQFMFGA